MFQSKHVVFPKYLAHLTKLSISVNVNSIFATQPIKQSSLRSLSLIPHINPSAIQYDSTATATTLIKATICILLITLLQSYFQHGSQGIPAKY